MRTATLITAAILLSGSVQAQDMQDLVRRSQTSGLPSPSPAAIIPNTVTKIVDDPVPEAVPSTTATAATTLTPTPVATPAPTPTPDPFAISEAIKWKLDPKFNIPADEYAKTPFEPTALVVNRVIEASDVDQANPDRKLWSETLRINIPVLFRSRTIVWNAEQTSRAENIIRRLEEVRKKTAELQEERKKIREDWNKLIKEGSPEEVLYADSPSVPKSSDAPAAPGFEADRWIMINIDEEKK